MSLALPSLYTTKCDVLRLFDLGNQGGLTAVHGPSAANPTRFLRSKWGHHIESQNVPLPVRRLSPCLETAYGLEDAETAILDLAEALAAMGRCPWYRKTTLEPRHRNFYPPSSILQSLPTGKNPNNDSLLQ